VKFEAVRSDGQTQEFILYDAIYSSQSPYNLVSLGRLRRNVGVSANIEDLKLRDKKFEKELALLYVEHDCFFMRTILRTENAYVTKSKPAKTAVVSLMLLHRRMGHLGFSRLK